MALRRPLVAGSGEPSVLVLKSRAEALRPLDTLRTALAVAALVAVAVSLLLSWAVARTVTRPLAALTDAMKEIAATGDLTREIGPGRPWDDEDARLVARTFNTLTDSIARFQREAALRDRLSALGRLSTIVAHEVRNPLMIIKGSLRTLATRGCVAGGDPRGDRGHRSRGGPAGPHRRRRPRLRAAPRGRAGADRSRRGGARRDGRRTGGVRGRERPVTRSTRPSGTRIDRRRAPADGPREPRGERARQHPAPPGGRRRRGPGQGSTSRSGAGRRRRARAPLGRGPGAWASRPATCRASSSPTSPPSGPAPGSGLAIARKVVEALGGAIRVESREGEGTRVEIDLPAPVPETGPREAS